VVTLQVYFPGSESPRRRRRRGCHKWVVCYGIHLPCAPYTRDREGMAPFPRLLPKLRLQNVFHVIRAPQSTISLREACNVSRRCSIPHPPPQVFCLGRIAPTYAIIHGHFAVVPSERIQSAALPLSLRHHPCCLTPESGWNATYRKSTYLAVLPQRDKRGQGFYLS
jgi:hypothetical protein